MRNFFVGAAALFTLTAMFIIGVAPGLVSADEYSRSDSSAMSNKGMEKDDMMMGKHDMSATVESINHKTGFMKLKTGMGEMTIHYPPKTVSDLNKGDKITVHLGYSKEGG